MPVYTYRCEACGVQFDIHQSFSENSLTRCPECNKKALRKVYLPVGIVFKGSGFYATDHKSPSGNSALRSKENQEQKSTEAKTGEEKSKSVASDKPSGDSASKE
jgi:putative FmdB family regulatory protein